MLIPMVEGVGSTNSSAPLISECYDACRGVSTDAGDWYADLTGKPEGVKSLLVGYACTFSIGRGPSQGDPLAFSLHNQDILDIYDGAISRFGSDGRVSASGTMICEGNQVAWWVD
ncbi:uncharacterized protein BCR38DRAFT_448739 [Pseudomassariella vexata]|uniref:Ecp2 effector protein-like domain-containing protein n=1 Tax=Pseudomassariella vexata TaxID=1141098 RepID=A0A1Y2DFA2_9PEZI|nr:uncharacterized protein BCR38DRAFT_448739 [Pseudomassariella vexata]ORY57816.1 hypothetical protein BCR38DRAFT_448739 [Pseudomassariella vexata]